MPIQIRNDDETEEAAAGRVHHWSASPVLAVIFSVVVSVATCAVSWGRIDQVLTDFQAMKISDRFRDNDTAIVSLRASLETEAALRTRNEKEIAEIKERQLRDMEDIRDALAKIRDYIDKKTEKPR
jgi:hypothetical protein